MKVHWYFWPAMQGAGIALLFIVACTAFFYALDPAPTFAGICARTNERGSSAWVACVDKMVEEQH